MAGLADMLPPEAEPVVVGTPLAPPQPVTGPMSAAAAPVAEKTPFAQPDFREGQGRGRRIFQDVLGALGDAMLVQGRSKPVYAPWKAERELGAAVAAFDPKRPDESFAAIAQRDPDMAAKMREHYNVNEARKDQQAYIQQYRESETAAKKALADDKIVNRWSAMFRSADEKSYKTILEQFKKGVVAAGVDFEALGLPEEYNKDIVDGIIDTTVSGSAAQAAETQERTRESINQLKEQQLMIQHLATNGQLGNYSAMKADREEQRELERERLTFDKDKEAYFQKNPTQRPGYNYPRAPAKGAAVGRKIEGYPGLWAPGPNGKMVQVK